MGAYKKNRRSELQSMKKAARVQACTIRPQEAMLKKVFETLYDLSFKTENKRVPDKL